MYHDDETITLKSGQSIKIKNIQEFNIQTHLINDVSILQFVCLLFQWVW